MNYNYFKDNETGEIFAYDEIQVSNRIVRPDLIPLAGDELYDHLNQGSKSLSFDELERIAYIERDRLLTASSIRVSPLQDASDLGDETEEEAALLVEWKKYRVALNRISSQPKFPEKIDWPVQPSQ